MALVFYSLTDNAERWRRALQQELPELPFMSWEQALAEPSRVRWALVWRPPVGALRAFPALETIFSLGAGVDHLLDQPELPAGVPIVRLVDEGLPQRMAEYVALHVLRYHRRVPELERAQRARRWRGLFTPLARERRVTLLGMGEMGRAAARVLRALGFQVRGWARRARVEDGVRCAAGHAALPELLAKTDILVCLLPLTPATRGLLDATLLGHLPRGAALINAGRGPQVVEPALRELLDSGHLQGATLDVFEHEPLAPEHWTWTHPGVTVTCHTASLTDSRTAAVAVAAGIRQLRAGAPPAYVVDPQRGY